jgi:hypothetical protein
MRGPITTGLVCLLTACTTTPPPAPPSASQQPSFDALVMNLRANQPRQPAPAALTHDEITAVIE